MIIRNEREDGYRPKGQSCDLCDERLDDYPILYWSDAGSIKLCAECCCYMHVRKGFLRDFEEMIAIVEKQIGFESTTETDANAGTGTMESGAITTTVTDGQGGRK
jgi:hypothetical protein